MVNTLIVKEFGPLNRILINLISEFLLVFTGIFDSNLFDQKYMAIYLIIAHSIILFGVFGYNEIFVLHVYRLDFYTKKAITYRANHTKFQISLIENEKQGPLLTD